MYDSKEDFHLMTLSSKTQQSHLSSKKILMIDSEITQGVQGTYGNVKKLLYILKLTDVKNCRYVPTTLCL